MGNERRRRRASAKEWAHAWLHWQDSRHRYAMLNIKGSVPTLTINFHLILLSVDSLYTSLSHRIQHHGDIAGELPPDNIYLGPYSNISTKITAVKNSFFNSGCLFLVVYNSWTKCKFVLFSFPPVSQWGSTLVFPLFFWRVEPIKETHWTGCTIFIIPTHF